MKRLLLAVCIGLMGVQGLLAQSPTRLVQTTGVLRDAAGQVRVGSAAVTFTIYAEQEGGEPLWRETQTLELDASGQYSTLLGLTQPEGLPVELFSGTEARWLGVAVDGGPEGPRKFWASVPYSLKAADAETVGGLPVSAFVLTPEYRESASAPGDALPSLPPTDGDGSPVGIVADPVAPADQVIADDLIVDGSLCVGFDCVNGESFGFDTIRLKENNVRINFFDTSSTSSFPSRDWTILVNDSSNGGLERFSIQDVTAGRIPFTIEGAAPSNSLYVEDSGELGLGTNNPVVNVHVVDGNTPTMRLEQDGSSGFTPQTWDLAGNETNFFVRDVTNGSKLPFRIRPNAPTSSIDISASGNVGFGTASPDALTGIHVKRSGIVVPTFESSDNNAVQFRIKTNSTNRRILALDGSNNQESQIVLLDNGAFQFLGPTASDVRAVIAANGDFTAQGTVFANNGSNSLPDYVFEPDYPLMSIAEVAEFVAREKHLPNVPSADEVKAQGRIDVVQLQLRLLEKVEELTLYTIAQQDRILAQEERIKELEALGERK